MNTERQQKHFRGTIILAITLSVLSGCQRETVAMPPAPSQNPGKGATFNVEIGFESRVDIPEYYMHEIEIPFVSNSTPEYEIINNLIKEDFSSVMVDYSDGQYCIPREGFLYTWQKIYFGVNRQDGICSLNIFSTVSSAYGSYAPYQWVHSYYYDENNGTVLDKSQYLLNMGYTQDELVNAYISTWCPGQSPEDIDFNKVLFYFEHGDNLKFIFNETAFIGQGDGFHDPILEKGNKN